MSKENDYKVYVHINKTPSKDGVYKKYYGITGELKVEDRWGNNGCKYKRKNKNGNYTYFYSAILKYGWDNFEHRIVAHGLTEKQAKRWEQKLIAYYHTDDDKYGYNGTKGGEGGIPNEETRKKMSEATKKRFEDIAERDKISKYKKDGKYWAGENNPMYDKHLCGGDNYNAVSVISIIKQNIYSTLRECCKAEDKDISGIIKHCRNKLKAKPQEFIYYEDWLQLNKKQQEDKIQNIKLYYDKLKVVRLKDGKIYNSMKECCLENEVSKALMIKHCKGRLKANPQKYMYYIDWLNSIDTFNNI